MTVNDLISNLFTESDFDNYRELESILEADEDDDTPDEEYDMPDDNNDQNPPADNNAETVPTDDVDTPAEDYDMPEDEPAPQSDGAPDPAANTTQEPTPQSDISGDDIQTPDDNFDMPDDQPAPQSEEVPADNAQQSDTNTDVNQQTDVNAADSGDDDVNMPDENFDLPDDGGGDASSDGGDTGATSDTSTTDTSSTDTTDSGPDPDQGLKDTENEIFDNLSGKDKAIKTNELKSLYEELYNRINDLYNKVNDLPKDEELVKVYDFVMNNLSDMKQFVYDYSTNMFDNKTYLENLVNYKKYLSTLNTINGILDEVRKGSYSDVK